MQTNDDAGVKYDDLFIDFSNRIEKWIKRCLVYLLVMLTLSQFMLQFTSLRYIFSKVDRMEGVPYIGESVQ